MKAKKKKKAKKKRVRIATYNYAFLGWWADGSAVGSGRSVAQAHDQPTRKRAIAMVRAALEAGGYEVEG